MKISILNKKRGFTLIELLVVIAIIAILTAIIIPNLTGSKAKARDAKRVADLGNIQLALELFYDRCKEYPNALDPSYVCPSISTVTFGTYMSTVPKDPTTGTVYQYDYDVDANGKPNRYILEATLESYSSVLKDDVDGNDAQTINYDCGTANNGQGTAERNYCLSDK